VSPARLADPGPGLRHRSARDPLVRSIRDAAHDTGAEVWLVGGYVRDVALGVRPADVDLAAGRGAAALVRRLQSQWNRRGFRFRKRGVTTWRVRVGDREVDLVDASRRGLEADLRRRELTINAMAFDLREGRFVDPLRGLRDLRAGRLCAPGDDVVGDDPVRALRIARFLAYLPGFRLDRKTRAQATAVAGRLRRASPERVRDELDRLLVSPAPKLGLTTLDELGLVAPVLPELIPLRECVAGRDRPDVWTHTLAAIDEASRIRRLPGAAATRQPRASLVLRWSLLLHDIAKPDTLARADDGRPTFHAHEVLGSRRARGLMDRLVQPRWLRRRVVRVVAYHLRPHQLADAGAPARGMRRLVREADEDLPVLLVHAAADARASGAPDAAAKWRALRPVLGELDTIYRRSLRAPRVPLLSGSEVMETLGIGPGPEVGRRLAEIRDLQDGGVVATREQALAHLRRSSG
jgi:poly(A) polymerase